MPRAARPSDIYRLPDQTRPTSATPTPPEPPRRRIPAWVGVAGLLAAALIIAGLVRGATDAAPGNVPLVDVVSEDQAVAALRLYGAQATTIDELRERKDIYANPGPGDAGAVAARGATETQQALDGVRSMGNLDPLAEAYAFSEQHAKTTQDLGNAAQLANAIALLASTHDTLYSGSGAIPLEQARNQLNGLAAGGRSPRPILQWSHALLEQMEDRNRVQQAAEARAATQQLWAGAIETLQPAALPELQTYINGLPPVTVDGLRGHPIAGPALRNLEQRSRQVSVRVPPVLAGVAEVPVDVLGFEEGFQALLPQLAPATSHLHPAEGAGVVVGQRIVDPHGARLDLFEETLAQRGIG